MSLDLSLHFLPEALAGLSPVRSLDDEDLRRLNQIRASSYLHAFDVFETTLSTVARERASVDSDARAVLAPLLERDVFDHHELFVAFEAAFADAFAVPPRLVEPPQDLARTLLCATPHALLVLALQLKLVTQQHYLACVRGDESLEPHFVRLLKEHWSMECGTGPRCRSAAAIQAALAAAPPEAVTPSLRDYRIVIFSCDDVLRRQAELDVLTLEDARTEPLPPGERALVTAAQVASHRKTFLTVGIVNAAFVYAMRTLGPTAPSVLAGVVSALSSR